ncbi:MAG: protein kinase, partial [Verrucomicrobia bacterium]|nr:protein kinase [Verrucomicrobiota bacterium]
MDQDHSWAAPDPKAFEATPASHLPEGAPASASCPTCGTLYPASASSAEAERVGCPVCLLRGGLDSGAPIRPSGSPDERSSRPEEAGRFDHYALVRGPDGAFDELGRGAMGITYRALDTVLGHSVALKVLGAGLAAHPQARERFLREARAAARLRHPNVASVFYYGVRKSDGQCFYAMELVEGETLEARLRREG